MRGRRRWLAVTLVLAAVATAISGVVVGYGVLWFQLFGETPDAEDYLVSAGGYGAAAAVLALGAPALLAHGAPRWSAIASGWAALALGLLAVTSAVSVSGAERSGATIDTAWDGIGGVLWAPWTWLLVVLGVRALVHGLRGSDPVADRGVA